MRLSSIAERFRTSLFVTPMVAVFIAIASAAASLDLDHRLDNGSTRLPLGLTSTVDSARALLSTIAGATITFAAIAFSISLLIIQQASSQYSPRVVHTLFRDPFNKRIMGLVVGTFTYCLLVLRSVRTALEQTGAPIIPNVSVAVAVVLGVVTILAIVAFINHSAHSMDISEILETIRRETITLIRREWSTSPPDADPTEPAPAPHQIASTITFERSGWIQQIDPDALLQCIPPRCTMYVDAYAGRYAIEGTPLCRLSTVPDDIERLERQVRAAVSTGRTRTMQQDVSFGLRQLADIALKALSPGINDPTTAQDSIFHTTAVLAEALRRDPPPGSRTDGNRRLVLTQQPTHDDLIRLAFDETRRAANTQPTVCIYLLEALKLLADALHAAQLTARIPAVADQARLVVAGCEAADNLPADRQQVKDAYTRRFAGPP